jgi:Ser/Thr protein kinase RdoA (MazF antagonist)
LKGRKLCPGDRKIKAYSAAGEVGGSKSMTAHVEPLAGGLQLGRVVRIGDTVRRPAGPWTPSVHAFLIHLRDRGFPAPQPLGRDEEGREVLRFMQGAAANWPWPRVLVEGDGVAQIGALLRACHEAAADFTPPLGVRWRDGAGAPEAGQIVLHGDFGPYNLIWNGDELVGVIDWDLARPGFAIEEAAFAAIHCAPLRPDEVCASMGFGEPPDRKARLAAFARAYGGASPADLIEAALGVQASEAARIRRLGAAGLEPWTTFLRMGLADRCDLERAWLAQARDRLT